MAEIRLDAVTKRVVEQLLPLGPVVVLRRFGAVELQLEEHAFGVVRSGTVYFRTSPGAVERRLRAGAHVLAQPPPEGGDDGRIYVSIAPEVIAHSDLVCAMAYEALAQCARGEVAARDAPPVSGRAGG